MYIHTHIYTYALMKTSLFAAIKLLRKANKISKKLKRINSKRKLFRLKKPSKPMKRKQNPSYISTNTKI